MDMSGELKYIASEECNVNYIDSNEDDENDIEDCFLKRLEWEGHVEDLISHDVISQDSTSVNCNDSQNEEEIVLKCSGNQVKMVEAECENVKLSLP